VANGIDLERLDHERAGLVPRRAALRRELALGDADFVFLCIGSFERRKNHLGLVEAFQAFVDEGRGERDRCRLLLLGDPRPHAEGPEAGLADEVAAAIRPGHRDRIRLVGARPSALPLLAVADCHVLVSTNESSPLANLEAMAFGVPCISSRVDGIPEVVREGETGFLVDPGDRPAIRAALARVWRMTLARDPALEALRGRARDFVRGAHDVAATSERLLDEIRRVLREVPDRRIAAAPPAEADRYVQRQLIQRWAVFKKDVEVECHVVRSHCHRFYEPPLLGDGTAAATVRRS
jgi:glycosyltransferase involved in cell wall biosynthesis